MDWSPAESLIYAEWQSHPVDSVARQSAEAKPATRRSQMVLAFHKWRSCMTKLKPLSAALIATAMIATPAMAQKGRVTSRHRVEDANASTTPAPRYRNERHCQ